MTEVLKGVRVVELGTMITAPLAGMMLADLGAEVIKVERPDGGDPFRSFRGGLYSPQFVAYNRNKHSIVLDLQNKEGRSALNELLSGSDVLVENYRPGVMERLGLAPKLLCEQFPRLVACSITGFGPDGPYAGRPAYDAVSCALSGISSLMIDSEQPVASGPTIADNVTGMYAAYGILGALYEREKTGRGRRIEVNMLEASIAFIPDSFANQTFLGVANSPRLRVANSLSFALSCADRRLLALHLSSQEKFWSSLLVVIARPDLANDARFNTRDARVSNYLELEQELAIVFASQERSHWTNQLERADVPFAPIQTISEVMEDPQVRHLRTFYDMAHPTEGSLLGINRPVWIDGSREITRRPPPTLGEHSASAFVRLSRLGSDDC